MFSHRKYVYGHYYWYDRLAEPGLPALALSLFPRRLIIELNRRDRSGRFYSAAVGAGEIERIYDLLAPEDRASTVIFDRLTANGGHEMSVSEVKAEIDRWFGLGASVSGERCDGTVVPSTVAPPHRRTDH